MKEEYVSAKTPGENKKTPAKADSFNPVNSSCHCPQLVELAWIRAETRVQRECPVAVELTDFRLILMSLKTAAGDQRLFRAVPFPPASVFMCQS